MTPKVTVLMSVYNSEDFLKDAIESILFQTFTDFKFLIINDGSTDQCVNIIKSYDDPRISLIHNRQNIGLTKSLNRGLRLVSSEYIARMDADEISLPERLEKQLECMTKSQEVGVCGTLTKTIGDAESVWKIPLEHERIRAMMLFENPIVHASAFLRTCLVKGKNDYYDESYVFAQDYELWLRLSSLTKLANVNQCLLLHRIHNKTVSRLHENTQSKYAKRIRKKQLETLKLSFNNDELDMHNRLSIGHIKNESYFLINAHCWLLKLWRANEKEKLFNDNAFSEELEYRMKRVLKKGRNFGVTAVKIIFSSPIFKWSRIPLRNQIRYALGCFF